MEIDYLTREKAWTGLERKNLICIASFDVAINKPGNICIYGIHIQCFSTRKIIKKWDSRYFLIVPENIFQWNMFLYVFWFQILLILRKNRKWNSKNLSVSFVVLISWMRWQGLLLVKRNSVLLRNPFIVCRWKGFFVQWILKILLLTIKSWKI